MSDLTYQQARREPVYRSARHGDLACPVAFAQAVNDRLWGMMSWQTEMTAGNTVGTASRTADA